MAEEAQNSTYLKELFWRLSELTLVMDVFCANTDYYDTMWILGVELMLLGLAASTFTF